MASEVEKLEVKKAQKHGEIEYSPFPLSPSKKPKNVDGRVGKHFNEGGKKESV